MVSGKSRCPFPGPVVSVNSPSLYPILREKASRGVKKDSAPAEKFHRIVSA